MLRLVSYIVIALFLLVHSSVVFCQQPTFFINARKTSLSLQEGQKRLFKIRLQKDRLVQISTRKTQGNFIISLSSTNKEVLLKFDSRRSSLDPELFWIATSSGEYTLQIEALEKKSLLQVLIQIQNSPSSTQKQNAEANRLFSNAEQYSTQGDGAGLRQAVNLYSSAHNLYKALGNSYMDALSEHNLALTYLQMGNLSESKAHFEASLQNFTLAKSPEGRAYCLVNLSSLYRSAGDPQKAMEVLEEALQLKQQLKNPYAKASIFENLAMVYMQTGELERALEVTEESLVLHTEMGNQQYISYDINLLGLIYLYLGDQEKALEAFQKTLAFYKKTNNLAGQANSLANLAAVCIEMESYQQALEYNTQALALFTHDTDNKLSALNNLGTIYAYLNDHKTSLEYYLKAFEIAQKITDSIGQGTLIGNIGSSYLELGDIDKAIEYLNQALEIKRSNGDRNGQTVTLLKLAKAYVKHSEFSRASKLIKEAFAVIEFLRARTGSFDNKTTYLANLRSQYDIAISLLVEAYFATGDEQYTIEAFEISERARARVLLEMLTESKLSLQQSIDPKLLEKKLKLQHKINSLEFERITTLRQPNAVNNLNRIRVEVEKSIADYRANEEDIRKTNPKYSSLTQPKPLSLKEIQKEVIEEATVLLEYWVGKDSSYLWIVSKESIKTYKLAAQKEIADVATALHKDLLQMRKDRTAYQQLSEKLSQMILLPAKEQLVGKRLLIVADGVLQYLPFAVLPIEKNSPLIVTNELVYLPSASTLAINRIEAKSKQEYNDPRLIAVIADPVFELEDQRLGGIRKTAAKERNLTPVKATPSSKPNRLKIPRLPFTKIEADKISLLAGNKKSLKLVGFSATKSSMSNLADFKYIHIATHAFVDSTNPELSALVFSLYNRRGIPQDGFLRTHEVFNLSLPVEMVGLSACETALGKQIKSEGLVGLTRAFMYAGAKRVLVALWSINDEATSELMTNFYQKIFQQKLSPASALRQAQIETLKSSRFQDPFYWAPFIIEGEYK